MTNLKPYLAGLAACFLLACPAWLLGGLLPVVGGPVFAILMGMTLAPVLKSRGRLQAGINFTSKKILQYAVILLGFGLNLSVIAQIGLLSLPIIVATIAVALAVAYTIHKVLRVPGNTSILVGVGSSICGGSAIAAAAPVIGAGDEEVAQSIAVIFFFNLLAAVTFPALGSFLGFSAVSGEAFGIFAGTAINDTSSVTAAASTWDSLHNLGSATLDMAVTVKLTRTLAIIPITLGLAFFRVRQAETQPGSQASSKSSFRKIFPFFILWFMAASAVTTVAAEFGVGPEVFAPLKTLSKFLIVMAMGAIGLNTDIVKLIKTGGKPLLMGFGCWLSIIAVSLLAQRLLNLW